MPEHALPLSGISVAYARGSRQKHDKERFSFRVGVSRFAGTVYCLAQMEAADEGSLVESGLIAYVQKDAGKILAELPDDEMLNAVRKGYIQHVLFDAAAATLRQLVAIVAAEVHLPDATVEPEYYILDLDAPMAGAPGFESDAQPPQKS